MPELPEVEVVCRGLRETVVGKTIDAVISQAPRSSLAVSPSLGHASFSEILKGRRIERVDRRGKNILIRLSGDLTLWVHLKMTGHFFYKDASLPLDKHDLVIFDFAQPKRSPVRYHLRFNDYRRFGRLRLFGNDELLDQQGLRELGPEPLKIPFREFEALCRRSHRMIKPALLDQSFLAGIGNIYADEALYAARIHPMRIVSSLSRPKLMELHGHITRLLKKAIRSMGTSVDSFSGVHGRTGNFQKYLRVYGREGESCDRCGQTIVRKKLGARSAHFCSRCQRIR